MGAPKLSVCLPFPGFYCSILSSEVDATEEYMAECMAEEPERDGLPADVTREEIAAVLWDCVDNRAVEKALAEDYASTLAEMVNERQKEFEDAPFSFEFEEMTSPREYNFTTDRIFALVPLADLERMREAVSPATFAAVLRERFTSCDGFISFYSNDPEEWNAKPLAEWDHNETGALFAAWLADNLEGAGDIENHVSMAMTERGDSPFYAAVSENFDAAQLIERIQQEREK